MAKNEHSRLVSPENADVEATAEARFSELRFEKVPETETRFRGNHGQEAASGSDRENLPEKVEPEVTYRDASIRWRAAARLTGDGPESGRPPM